ncbi:MAG: adenylosuccinate synthetase, partial [Bacteroidales bacterium]|nr:adenylosuccinate synthetase [Bacteroidales bacterium]
FIAECDNIRKVTGIEPEKKLVIARKAHLILPTHRLLDAAREAAAGKGKIGSTLKGIGPCYSDKIGRNGVRVGDIETPDFRAKYQKLTNLHKQQLANLNFEFDQAALEEDAFFAAVERMKAFKFVDCEFFVDDVLKEQSILAEGAQGSMLDIDYGSYPFVTSSNTTCGGVCTGMGAAPCRIGKVYGIFKAYCTRVGSGPFPTELFDATGEELRRIGHEYGAVTGRPRRCGWIDLVALKYAVTLSGVTDLIMMKSDCLDTFDTIKACTSYLVDGKETDRFPYDISDGRVTPVYTEFPGWKTCLADIRKEEDLPQTFMNYVKFVENYLGAKISIISLGPDREATIERV